VRVAAVVRDLMTFSRILEAATRSGAQLHRFDSPADLPPTDPIDLLLVDWSDRSPDWSSGIVVWRDSHGPTRIVIFGAHTDLEAHAAARAAGLAPMWARSKLVASLDLLLKSE
jgi:hypothetical protein